MTIRNWDESRIQSLIDLGQEETNDIEYKSSGAFGRNNDKKVKITIDVSSMANSAGGVIFYGVKEFDAADKRHLPERIDPVDQIDFPKEWLERVINSIRPRIQGIKIHPVSIGTNQDQVVYVLEIPQGLTAHQARDHRYYKRYNFESIPMEDYEIRDVMSRSNHPDISLEFEFGWISEEYKLPALFVRAINQGRRYANYVVAIVEIPVEILQDLKPNQSKGHFETKEFVNKTFDALPSYGITSTAPGSYSYEPILPGLAHTWDIPVGTNIRPNVYDGLALKWAVYADNAPPNEGEIKVVEITNFNILEEPSK